MGPNSLTWHRRCPHCPSLHPYTLHCLFHVLLVWTKLFPFFVPLKLPECSSHHSLSDDAHSSFCLGSVTSPPQRPPRTSTNPAPSPCVVALGHPVHSLLEQASHVPLCMAVLFMRFSSPVALKAPLGVALPRLIYLYASNAWQ